MPNQHIFGGLVRALGRKRAIDLLTELGQKIPVDKWSLHSFLDGNLGSLTTATALLIGEDLSKKGDETGKRCGKTLGHQFRRLMEIIEAMIITWKRMTQCQPLDPVKGFVSFWQGLRDKNLCRTYCIGSNMLKMGKGQISVNDSHLSLTLDALTQTVLEQS